LPIIRFYLLRHEARFRQLFCIYGVVCLNLCYKCFSIVALNCPCK